MERTPPEGGVGDDAELVTPELTGTLLPGITRDSLITLARDLGHRVTERRFGVEEWRRGVADGSIEIIEYMPMPGM